MSSRPPTREMASRPITRAGTGTRASTRASRFSTFTDLESDDPRASSLDFVMLNEAEATKIYMADRKIPQMMDCLLSSLMMERPEDIVHFLQEQLEKIKKAGPENVNWETFVRHLHPYRDGLRLDMIRDDSRFQVEHLRKLNKVIPNRRGEYRPEVFSLTETEEALE